MNLDEWQSCIPPKIYFMAKNIWNGLSQKDIDRFIENFKDKKEVGWALLEMLIYYSEEQAVYLASYLYKCLKRDLWLESVKDGHNEINDSNLINNYIEGILHDACFVPLDKEVDGSAFALPQIYKKVKDFPKSIDFCQINDIPLMIALKKKYFIFFDDIIGTGTQFTTFWKKTEHFSSGKRKITLSQLAKINNEVHFYYLVFGAHSETLRKLKADYPNIRIIASEIFTKECSVLSPDNEYWEMNKELKGLVSKYVIDKLNEFDFKEDYSLNIPVLFQHCRAQNTSLPLYWTNKNDWKELCKR